MCFSGIVVNPVASDIFGKMWKEKATINYGSFFGFVLEGY
jgi:hypothetical protein